MLQAGLRRTLAFDIPARLSPSSRPFAGTGVPRADRLTLRPFSFRGAFPAFIRPGGDPHRGRIRNGSGPAACSVGGS